MTTKIDIYRKKPERSKTRRRKGSEQFDIGARRRDTRPMSRRQKPRGLINFWDLGQRKNGSSWEDLDFAFQNINTSTGSFRQNPPTLADWNVMISEIFEIPVNQWKTEYRQMSYENAERLGIELVDPALFDLSTSFPDKIFSAARAGSRFKLDPTDPAIVVDGAKWTPSGFELAATDFSEGVGSFAFQDGGAFLGFGAGRSYQKITSVNDYSAAEVSFSLAVGLPVNVYLIPRLASQAIISVDGSSITQSEMVGPVRPYSREIWFELEPDAVGSGTPVGYPVLAFSGSSQLYFGTAKTLTVYNHIASHPLTRTFTNVLGTVVESSFVGTPRLFAGEIFGFGLGVMQPTIDLYPPEGLLMGVIEQSGTFYYFWANGSVPGQSVANSNALSRLVGLNY